MSLSNLNDESVVIFKFFELFLIADGLNDAHSKKIHLVSWEIDVRFPPTTPATAIGPLPSKMERDPLVLQISFERVSISESILSEIWILDLSIKSESNAWRGWPVVIIK